MAAHVDLSQRDMNVLEKMRDPDFNPETSLVLDERLPRDPHLTDPAVYEHVASRERAIVQSLQALEADLAQAQDLDADARAVDGYRTAITALDQLISEHPRYASARNNRAQATRRLYGDLMLLSVTTTSAASAVPLIPAPAADEKRQAAARALADLETSIALLTPRALASPMAPTAARTLSSALTQRGAVYLQTGKMLRADRALDVDQSRDEASWSAHRFQEAASHDLALGGRYGNEIAKNLAVSVNPTAKLCGQIVREAMRKEYGPGFIGPEPEE
ncbi:hypothetical protein CCM_00269 [Cordyceps militaris CM01]|uniref:Uncharacterized protein n=1 Tax=Cordyceps militaris (strain CM01) TaxID=983644 RepID=G3J332_CORMM|nr:uncharacterized protein CCM_00269 [Cordyceps militaris CM01]EGX95615.1 hypothetical protein CCM_00269 [Cordyceps militaris CM01]